ncbi:MAG: hypothetical protein ACFHVJ_08320 [Aestuariibacter sp.]
MFDTKAWNNNSFLSPQNAELIIRFSDRKELRDFNLDKDNSALANFVSSYHYPVENWPLFLSADRVDEVKAMLEPLPAIAYKAIRTFFKNNPTLFSEYLNQPDVLLAVLEQHNLDSRELIMRQDVIYTNNELKIIEINSGSNIGGWQLSLMEAQFREGLELFNENQQTAFHHINVLEQILATISKSIARIKKRKATGNIVLFRSYQDIPDKQNKMENFLHGYYDRIKPSHMQNGKLIFINDHKELEFTADNRVKVQGEVVDTVLLTAANNEEFLPHINIRLISCYLADNIVLPDSPLHTVLSNKSVFALLHEPELKANWTPQERNYIERHIPWTARLRDCEIHYKGKCYNVYDLLLQNKDQLVLKKGDGLQGDDVHVGRFIDVQNWLEIGKRYMDQPLWLIQEFCEPDVLVLPLPDVAPEENLYSSVWGFYSMDNHYQGAFVRVKPILHNDGVINSARGAVELAVFSESVSSESDVTTIEI